MTDKTYNPDVLSCLANLSNDEVFTPPEVANAMLDFQERVHHIFSKQLYAIAITELTSLLARRSVYCSKDASSKYSVSHFDKAEGNIFYTPTKI